MLRAVAFYVDFIDIIVSRGNIHGKNTTDNVIATFEGGWENLPHVIIVKIFVFKN